LPWFFLLTYLFIKILPKELHFGIAKTQPKNLYRKRGVKRKEVKKEKNEDREKSER